MTTPQTDPVQRNEAQHSDTGPDEASADSKDLSIDQSMADADLTNGEGDPDQPSQAASQIHRNGENDDDAEHDRPKPMRRAD